MSFIGILNHTSILYRRRKKTSFFSTKFRICGHSVAGSDYIKQNVLAIHALCSRKVLSIKAIEIFLKFEIKPKYPQ